MRHFPLIVGLLLLPATVQAQEKEKPGFLARIDKVRVGFQTYSASDGGGQFQIGMWAPVHVDVTAGPKGVPVTDPNAPPFLEFESSDSEGISTFYRIPVSLEPNETRTFIGYTKPGNFESAARVGVELHWDRKTFKPVQQFGGPLPELGTHLYLSLGSRIPDFRDALANYARALNPVQQPVDPGIRDTAPMYATFESEVARLPEHWFGYQSVELMILATDKKEFLTELLRDANRPRLQALAQWVRQGGRLVIPVHYQNQDILALFLQAPVWQPPVPVVPPANPGDVVKVALKRLDAVEAWAGTRAKPFPGPGGNPIPIAKLDPGLTAAGTWDIQAKTDDGRPLITKMPYGRGSIVYVAFSLDAPPFTRWDGKLEFLTNIVKEFGFPVKFDPNQHFIRGWQPNGVATDVTSNIHQHLDIFDVNVVPFGYVALFIILYILVVGPLDYFVLKHVFHKLEWTWITFPVVVLAVSIAAYFTAYALKGNDLKVNKIDVVDFDMRTDLDAKEQTAKSFAYGQSFFTVLSPRIQNYTVGVEVNPAFWGAKGGNPVSADQVSWLGRPDADGPGAMGRSGSQGFFRRPYSYAEEARGLRDVPIPVWTTKAFNASWEASLPKAPFPADLIYHTREFEGKNVILTGSIKNNLGVDLEDVWIFFGDRCFPIGGGLPCTANGAGPAKIALEAKHQKDFAAWFANTGGQQLAPRNINFRDLQGRYDPTPWIRQAMFFEKYDPQGTNARNHSLGFLDYSWRIQKDLVQGETRLREAILYAHVPFARGPADALTNGASPSPTNLWLGGLPEAGKTRPPLAGTLAQDTYIRVLLPVRAASVQ